ncbi:MAG: MerR family transcriptional regulator [Candidatus Omnitrophota bacterium]
MEKKLLTLKEIAVLMGLSVATANYYTNLGLFRIEKRRGNCRLYDKTDILQRFDKIKQLRSQGYSLGLIQRRLRESAA